MTLNLIFCFSFLKVWFSCSCCCYYSSDLTTVVEINRLMSCDHCFQHSSVIFLWKPRYGWLSSVEVLRDIHNEWRHMYVLSLSSKVIVGLSSRWCTEIICPILSFSRLRARQSTWRQDQHRALTVIMWLNQWFYEQNVSNFFLSWCHAASQPSWV